MHEVLNHPQASEILEICVSHAPNMGIDPIPTDGVSLALREDWQSLLETMKSLGTTTVWFTLHGLNAVALTAGIVTEEEVQRWRTSLEQADSNHTFFGSVTQVMVAGCKP